MDFVSSGYHNNESKFYEKTTINIIRPLLRLNDKDIIVVIVDQFTKIIKLKVTTIAVSLKNIAKIYQDKIHKIL